VKYWLVWFISIPMAQEAYIYIASLFRKTHRQGKTFLLIQLAMDVLAILSHYQVYHQFWYLKPFSKWWCQIPGIHRYPTTKLSG
jgi:hypothetical protein